MYMDEILNGVALEECMLTLEELAQSCAVEPQWVIARVEAGLLGYVTVTTDRAADADTEESESAIAELAAMRFASAELARARRLAELERDMDANPELAALVVDLIEEVQHLRRQLRAAGMR
ncbi:MAG: chaperone modulator CbpM [bacterium]|nr:chaperone modulator CbpM [bacterium]